MQARILLIEDDPGVGRPLQRALQSEGAEVAWAQSGTEAIMALDAAVPELVLLDLGLPDVDGIDLCRRIRAEHSETVILILTARDEEVDIVLGLDAGADDYLVKPFRLAELLARIRANLRRLVPAGPSRIAVGDVEIDVDARRVVVAGHEVELRSKEFDLLTFLASEAGRAVSRDRIMRSVWDENWWGSTKTLDMHISTLRRKLTEAGSEHEFITTLRGVGYRFETT